jgi:K(+)-stimulated pyrophosphate-energized sodium pump
MLFIGGMVPVVFSALAMNAVGKAAMEMVYEVRRQFKEIPGIMEGTGKPEYDKCVEISTNASLKEMMLPGILTIGLPLIITFIPMLFGMDNLIIAEMLGGYMAGVTVSGVLWAIFQNNAGGAWDNAKKSFDAGVMINGEMTHKGSAAHEAAITGDTVGDPFKDTSGPSMNILIKLTCLIGLVLAPILGEAGYISHEETIVNQQFTVESARLSSYATSFNFDIDTKTITDIAISKIVCNNNSEVCRELIKLSEEQNIMFNAQAMAIDIKAADSKFSRKVAGFLLVGKKKYKANLSFNITRDDNGSIFYGSILSEYGARKDEVIIEIKGRK